MLSENICWKNKIVMATGALWIACCDSLQCPQSVITETLLCQCIWSRRWAFVGAKVCRIRTVYSWSRKRSGNWILTLFLAARSTSITYTNVLWWCDQIFHANTCVNRFHEIFVLLSNCVMLWGWFVHISSVLCISSKPYSVPLLSCVSNY